MLKTFENFNYELYPLGKVYSLDDFIKKADTMEITPYDGTLAEVLINGKYSNLFVASWNMYAVDDDIVKIYLKELQQIKGKVEILWVAKKHDNRR